MKAKIGILFLLIIYMLTGCKTDYDDVLGKTVDGYLSDTKEFIAQTLTISMSNPKTLNPLINEDSRVDDILKIIYLPFVDIDIQDKVVPSIANSWTIADDGLSATFLIKDNLFWSDGTPITTNDVVFSFQTIKNASDVSMYKNVTNYVSSINKISATTVKVNFNKKFSGNLSILNFPIINSSTNNNKKLTMPISSGAYKVLEYVEASHIKLIPNQHFSGTTPNISEISVDMIPDYKTEIYAFEQRRIDLLSGNNINLGKYDYEENREVYQYISRDYDFIGFNFNKEILQNKYMRQAIAYAFPKQSILETVYLGYGVMTNTPVHPKSWLYEENVIPYLFDTNMSATLLKNNGWLDTNNDRILDLDGKNLNLTILINEESLEKQQIAKRFKDELDLLGFNITIDSQPFDVYEEKLKKQDYDLFIGSWKMSKALNLSDILHSNGRLNYNKYKDGETDELLNIAYEAMGDGERILAYSRLQQRLADELPYISIAYKNDGLVLNKNISGVEPKSENYFSGIEFWQLY